jgi:hypothetical protein
MTRRHECGHLPGDGPNVYRSTGSSATASTRIGVTACIRRSVAVANETGQVWSASPVRARSNSKTPLGLREILGSLVVPAGSVLPSSVIGGQLGLRSQVQNRRSRARPSDPHDECTGLGRGRGGERGLTLALGSEGQKGCHSLSGFRAEGRIAFY